MTRARPDVILPVEVVADQLGVEPHTIRRALRRAGWVNKGLGRQWAIRERDLPDLRKLLRI